MIIIRLLAGLLVAGLAGHLIVYFIDREKKMPAAEGIALSYLIGQGAITLLLFLLFLVPVARAPAVAAILIIVLFAIKWFIDRGKHGLDIGCPVEYKKDWLMLFLLLALIASFSIKVSYSFVEACSKPEYAWDASGNWTEVGKNVFYAEKYRPDKVIDQLKAHVSGYPREVSLMHFWLFWWMGEASDQWSKIIFPVELICLLIIFYYGLKPERGAPGALLFTYFLCSAPLFLYLSTIGYADLTKTVYFAAGIIGFYRWLQTKQDAYFYLFSLMMAFTSWVKIEGRALYALGLILLLFFLWHGYRGTIKSRIYYALKYLLMYVFIGLPWQAFVAFNHLFDPQGAVGLYFHNILEFHRKMYALMFMEGSWGIFWVFFSAGLLFFFKRQLKGNNLYLFAAMVLFYGNLLFIYFLKNR